MIDRDVLEARRRAVEEAMKFVLGFKRDVVGIGTGSTVDMFLDLLLSSTHLFIESYFVCASLYTARRLSEVGLKVLSISDGGVIVDIVPPQNFDPQQLDRELKSIPGVIETGIFTKDLVDIVVVGYPDKVVVMRKLIKTP